MCPRIILIPLPGRKWGAARSGGQRLLSQRSDGRVPRAPCSSASQSARNRDRPPGARVVSEQKSEFLGGRLSRLAQSASMPRFLTTKAHSSAISSMRLAVGLPAPWPALVSMRIKTGLSPVWASCNAAEEEKVSAMLCRKAQRVTESAHCVRSPSGAWPGTGDGNCGRTMFRPVVA